MGGGARTQKRALTYYSAKFSQKLHENEKNWTDIGEEARPKFCYVDPELSLVKHLMLLRSLLAWVNEGDF